ncbi:MAG: Na+/H+ antiporter NhaA [Thermodesulfobacteriota bacterium]|nr:Na+/H+ antiporter NhaA [Thermodesulfobacteriota bacterium]
MKPKPNKTVFERFFHSQTAGSIVLLLATITAVVWANSPWSDLYHTLSHLDIGTYFHGKQYHLTLDHWVKDGLMAIFFFVVGLEIKREILIGELSSVKKAMLPVMAALGGAVIPALIYFSFNPSGPAASGWGVPMATDIAFALGLLALFGKRVPIGLKVFLTALAIVDDLMAVLVIAIFYTDQINISALIAATFLLAFLGLIVRNNIHRPVCTFLLISGVWLCVFLSGIHATIAGVLLAMVVPVKATIEPKEFFNTLKQHKAWLKETKISRQSMVADKQQRQAIQQIYLAAERMIPAGIRLEEHLHPIQAFLILPLFALFAAGVTVDSNTLAAFPSTVSLGIIAGLLVGKQVGIVGFSFLVIRSGLTELPARVSWGQIWGVSLLGGIGFTMSIFISELAFTDEAMIADAKIAIFIASILAGICGYLVLQRSLPKK